MVKATKSRKPVGGERKSGAGTKTRTPVKVAKPTKLAKPAIAKPAVAKAPSGAKRTLKAGAKATPGSNLAKTPAPSAAKKPMPPGEAQTVKVNAPSVVMARPERLPPRPVVDPQPVERDSTPPALPVPIASFTF
jgi:hypothetical protein